MCTYHIRNLKEGDDIINVGLLIKDGGDLDKTIRALLASPLPGKISDVDNIVNREPECAGAQCTTHSISIKISWVDQTLG